MKRNETAGRVAVFVSGRDSRTGWGGGGGGVLRAVRISGSFIIFGGFPKKRRSRRTGTPQKIHYENRARGGNGTKAPPPPVHNNNNYNIMTNTCTGDRVEQAVMVSLTA